MTEQEQIIDTFAKAHPGFESKKNRIAGVMSRSIFQSSYHQSPLADQLQYAWNLATVEERKESLSLAIRSWTPNGFNVASAQPLSWGDK